MRERHSTFRAASTVALATALAMSLAGCGSTSHTAEETTAVTEATKEDFNLGDKDVTVSEVLPTTEAPTTEAVIEESVIETHADGTETVLLSNGDTRVSMNGTGLNAHDKLTESEVVYLDAIIGAWKTDGTLPQSYLGSQITKEAFPSLTDEEREGLIEEVTGDKAPGSGETAADETEPTDGELIGVGGEVSGNYLTDEEVGAILDKMTDEEIEAILEENGGGEIAHPDRVNLEALEGLSMGGSQ